MDGDPADSPKYETAFRESEAVLAVQNDDGVYAREVMAGMSVRELQELARTMTDVRELIYDVLKERPHGFVAQTR